MITTTPNFDAAAAATPAKPVFRFSITDYSKVFVWRKTGRDGELAWIESIGDWGVSVDPLNGSYTIDDLVLTVLDLAASITHDLSLLLLEGRRCVLQMGYEGLAPADYCTLFQGVVNNITSNPEGSYSFTCNDYNRLSQRVIYVEGDDGTVTTTVTTFSGNNPYTIRTDVATTDPITGVVTNATTLSYAGAYSGPANPGTYTAGTSTTVVTQRQVTSGGNTFNVNESVTTNINGSTTTVTTQSYGGQQLYGNVATTTQVQQSTGLSTSSVVVTYTTSGVVGTSTLSDNSLISSTNPKTLIGHPLDIMLNIYQEQIGFADSDINIAQIEQYRDSIFGGVEFQFILTGSVDAKDFIESQLLKPLGGYLYINSQGQQCVGFAQPLPGSVQSVATLTPANIPDLPTVTAHDLINVVTMRFDKDDAGISTSPSSSGFLAQANTFYEPSIQDFPDLSSEVAQEAVVNSGTVQGQLIIESDGMRSGFQGFVLAKMVSAALFSMYGFYNPTLDVSSFWNNLFKVELAEFVTLTHPLIPNRKTGVMGVVNQLFKVVKRSYNFLDLTVTFTLEDASGSALTEAHRIAPTADPANAGNPFPAYTNATDYEKGRYLFMSDPTGLQSNGDVAAKLG